MKFSIIAICMAMISIISTAQPVRINEVMSSNSGVIADSDGDSSDWIEFFNSGSSDVSLNGFGLSDSKGEPFKWIFPNYSVKPGEYLIVFASDKDRREAPGFWNTIISQGDDWKYLVPAAEPASTWRLSSFVDTNWNTGKSGFGMGDNDDATSVTVTRSIFLRKKFILSNPASVKQAVLHMDYDDGFVAYLNG
ncbi:MAG TPA: lamin tail domain-containing protein, partial [Prolixibacteraceae bacterium]|nr:lamin tail domain-containing protein [Prolixibacteraceae bacterium]